MPAWRSLPCNRRCRQSHRSVCGIVKRPRRVGRADNFWYRAPTCVEDDIRTRFLCACSRGLAELDVCHLVRCLLNPAPACRSPGWHFFFCHRELVRCFRSLIRIPGSPGWHCCCCHREQRFWGVTRQGKLNRFSLFLQTARAPIVLVVCAACDCPQGNCEVIRRVASGITGCRR